MWSVARKEVSRAMPPRRRAVDGRCTDAMYLVPFRAPFLEFPPAPAVCTASLRAWCCPERTPRAQALLANASLLMLQREIPEQVNEALAEAAAAANVPVRPPCPSPLR